MGGRKIVVRLPAAAAAAAAARDISLVPKASRNWLWSISSTPLKAPRA